MRILSIDPSDDTIDHIRIHPRARSPLGRYLDDSAVTPFVVPGEGNFKSMDAYCVWLLSDHRKGTRRLFGEVAVRFLLQVDSRLSSGQFDEQLARAFRCKLDQTFVRGTSLAAHIATTKVPFAIYEAVGGVAVLTDAPCWMKGLKVLKPQIGRLSNSRSMAKSGSVERSRKTAAA